MRIYEEKILDYMHSVNGFIHPINITKAIKGEKYHPAWASPICRRLANKGLLERSKDGLYRKI